MAQMNLLTNLTLDKLRELRACSQKAAALETQAAEFRQRQHQLQGDLGYLLRTLDIAGDAIPPEERAEVEKARMELNHPVVQEEAGGGGHEDLGPKTGVMYAVTALQQLSRPADTKTLLAKMQGMGYVPRAANPYVSLFSTLRRTAQRRDSRIDKRKGLWGLMEWSEEVWAKSQPRASSQEMMDEVINGLESED
jgi:hypothetical protein